MRRRGIGTVLVLAAVAVASACGSSGGATSTPSPSPTASTASQAPEVDWRIRSQLQTELLKSFIWSAQAWSHEPRGDVRPSSGVSSTLVFAKVIALPDHARRVRFDCYQLYVGNAAERAARQDGVDPATMNSPDYLRNRFSHVEELAVARDCPVVMLGNGDHVQDGFGGAASARLFYWLVIGQDRKIHGALWQPTY